jgi:hypothetical protein
MTASPACRSAGSGDMQSCAPNWTRAVASGTQRDAASGRRPPGHGHRAAPYGGDGLAKTLPRLLWIVLNAFRPYGERVAEGGLNPGPGHRVLACPGIGQPLLKPFARLALTADFGEGDGERPRPFRRSGSRGALSSAVRARNRSSSRSACQASRPAAGMTSVAAAPNSVAAPRCAPPAATSGRSTGGSSLL